jgi:uncharacterized membrane protein YbaN (DUF454 family)
VGIVSFGLAVLGALLPGLPTPVFLIVSSYCFAKSRPHLYEWLLVKNRLLHPYLAMLESDRPMSGRARVMAIGLMWFFISLRVVAFGSAGSSSAILQMTVVLAGVVGTVSILLFRRARVSHPVAVSEFLKTE